jgi:hypothetical protein
MGNKSQTLLGFAVTSGEPVSVPLHHMVVCGLTQMSGKTTTLEALIERSGLVAIAFRSKRGEEGFEGGQRIAPYFREQFDWEYVQDLLEASLQERMKFERSWIIQACKGARSLDQVHANVRKSLEKARGLSLSVYTNLNAYFEKIMPELLPLRRSDFQRLWTLSDQLAHEAKTKGRRLFVMDVSEFRLEVQSLIVRSTIADISEGTMPAVIVLPEAWKFLPQSRGNPAKRAAERLVREGAASGKFLWIDTQDITGCDKTILKSIDVWLLGRQRERNEIRRMLDQIPAAAKPKPQDIATLPLGQFFACFGRQVVRTYVVPAWADPDAARRCAKGEIPPPTRPAKPQEPPMEEVSRPVDQHTADLIDKLQRQTDLIHSLERQVEELVVELENKKRRSSAAAAPGPGHVEIGRIHGPGTGFDDGPPLLRTGTVSRAARSDAKSRTAADGQDDLVQEVLDRLRRDPDLLAVACRQKQISVHVEPVRIEIDGSTLRGRICRLVVAGFLDEPRTGNTIFNELRRAGARIAKPNVYRECKQLAEWGFLTIEAGGGYAAVPQMKRYIEEA